ncbi:MAG: flagellar basal body-associated FliL family protein [Syntrophobacterales bacterium]|jgi:flagellar basal body-associated protein FliL|nr:flagellar basal body-associated FliL family protein [Syntrophobacterales bacterium]
MVRKAQLDEIDLELPPEDDEQLPDEGDKKSKREAPDDDDDENDEEDEGESPFSFLGEKTGLTIFCILGCLLIISVAWGTWYFVKKGKQTPPSVAQTADIQMQEQEETDIVPVSEGLAIRHMAFQDFTIPLQEGNKYRLLEISFTVEIVENQRVRDDMINDPGVRRQIVNAVQSRGRDLFTAKNSRTMVKNDLLTLMTQILGENVVKNVYITDFKFI